MNKIVASVLLAVVAIVSPPPQRLHNMVLEQAGVQYVLQAGQLQVIEQGETIWQSPPEWRVDRVALGDTTGDGIVDINFSVWKAGNYGPDLPSWVEQNDDTVKQHFFVFNLINHQFQPVWQSSNLSKPNCDWQLANVDSDVQVELIAYEGEYRDDFQCLAQAQAVWKWQNWGFVNESRSVLY